MRTLVLITLESVFISLACTPFPLWIEYVLNCIEINCCCVIDRYVLLEPAFNECQTIN